MENNFFIKALVSLMLICFFARFAKLYNTLIGKPRKLRLALRKQGIRGPPGTFLLGNLLEIHKAFCDTAITGATNDFPASHNIQSLVFPFVDRWLEEYGDLFTISFGNTQILVVARSDIVRETMNTSANFGKPPYHMESLIPMLGDGVITSSGAKWHFQRKILAPEFRSEKLKGMTTLIQDAAHTVVDQWMAEIEEQGGIAEIHIDEYMKTFSAEVISKACFGSSYIEGQKIFSKLTDVWLTVSKGLVFNSIPGMRHINWRSNRTVKALEEEIQDSILKVIEELEEDGSTEKNMLQTVLEAAMSTSGLRQGFINKVIVDNCKSIYLAGYETTAVSAQWCLLLLSVYPEWQNRVRSEVIEVCKGQSPDHDMIARMKQLTKVIHETLRLYHPVPLIPREAFADLKFGDIHIPKGLNIWLLATTLHTDPKVWGPDAYKFNPDRFENGVAGECAFPHLYMPFGAGARVCLGQNLALLELKILISLLLSKFSFSLSPKYVHSPSYRLVVEPRYGIHLLVKKLSNAT